MDADINSLDLPDSSGLTVVYCDGRGNAMVRDSIQFRPGDSTVLRVHPQSSVTLDGAQLPEGNASVEYGPGDILRIMPPDRHGPDGPSRVLKLTASAPQYGTPLGEEW